MSMFSELLKGLGSNLTAAAGMAIQQTISEALAKLPAADALAARMLGNPRVKAWLAKQPIEDQAAVKRAAAIFASAALESVLKDLSR